MTAKPSKKTNKKYEKDRRDRIALKLSRLAEILPQYDKENPWSRLEILENSIQYILNWQQDNKRNEELMKRLLLEIKHLKEIIYAVSEFKYLKYNILKLSSVEIKQILRQLSDHNRLLMDKPAAKKETPPPVCNELPNPDLPETILSPPLQSTDTQSAVTTTSSSNKSKPVIQTTNSSITLQKPVLVSSSNQSINNGFSIEKAAVTTSTGNSILFSSQKTPSGGTIILNADKKLSSLELVPISAATPTSSSLASGQSSVESSPSISLAVSTRSPISPSNSSSSVIVSSAPSVSYILPSPKKNNQQLFIAPKQVSVAVVRPLGGQPTSSLVSALPVILKSGQVLVGSNGVYSLVQVGGCVTTNINPLVQLGTTNINQMTTSTSTVTCNTGLKVSVPPSSEYQPKKRSYRKRKLVSTTTTSSSQATNSTSDAAKTNNTPEANIKVDTSKNPGNTSDENAANQLTADSTLSTPAHQTAVSSKSTTEISAVCSEPAQEQPPEQLLEEETDDINEQTAVSNNDQVIDNDSKQDSSSQKNINDEPLAKVARFTNVETDSDKEAISDIVENLARLENNEELNIIQETITEDSQADQQTQDALPEVLPTSQVLLPEHQNNPQGNIGTNRREETADLTSRDVTHEQRTAIDDEKVAEIVKDKRGEKKRSKSSYSIPALCQISVNIGERPDVASSPGVFSLNSVGTISPTHTPVPTPDSKPPADSKNPEEHVIEELKTFRPEELLNQDDGVTMQIEISQALNDLDRDFNLDSIPTEEQAIKDIKMDGRNKQDDSSISGPLCQPQDSQNVYEFTEKPATPPPPLSKIRKDSKSPRQPKDDSARQKQILEKESKSKQQITVHPERKIPSTSSTGNHTSYMSHHQHHVSSNPTPTISTTSSSGNSQHQERKQHHQPQQLPTAAAAQPPAAVMAAQQQQVQPEEMIQDNTGSNSGYNTSETMDQNLSAYDTRIQNHHANMKQLVYPSHTPSAYHPGIQQASQRNSYMNYHYQSAGISNPSILPHSASGGSNLPNEQVPGIGGVQVNLGAEQQHHTPANYANYANLDTSDMKSYACGSQAVYPPANIQDFHSRSYYKSYSTGHHHYSGRSFHTQQEQMNAYAQDRKHRQHHNIHTQNASGMLDKSSSSLQQQDGDTAAATATFSVTQLVNTQGHTQRSASSSSSASKATKKSANTSSAKSTKKESAAEKREAAAARGEDRKAKSSSSAALSGGSSRRSRSGGAASRSTYSTESLLQQANMENSHHGKSNEEEKQHKQSPYKNSSSSMKEKSNRGGMTSNWSNEVNQHFGSLSFTSLSPSPGLFSADLSSFEFGILNPQDGSLGGRDYLGMAGPGSSSSAGASQHINHQHSHHKLQHSKHQQQLACQLSAAANQRMPPSSAAAGSNSSSSFSDWTSSGGIIEGSFLPPLPTLTPPTEDPMSYTFMPHSHSGFYTSSVACTSSAALQKGQNVYTTQSSHTSVPGFSSSMSMMGKVHQNFGSGGSGSISSSSAAAGSHMAALTASSHKVGSSNTGSLVNFNLSTIFPEINIPPMVAAGPNCQTKPLVGLPPLPPPEFLQGSRASSSSQLGTPDLITSHHSLPILGHSSQVVTSFSVAPPGISSNIVHGLAFPNLHE